MEITQTLEDILVPLAFFSAVVLSLYFYFRTRHQERMAMIDKGFELKEKKPRSHQTLKTGIFFIGISLGLFFGYLLKKFTIIDEVIAFFTMILLFGGISLVVNHYISLQLNKRVN